jgi:hypothetical protein
MKSKGHVFNIIKQPLISLCGKNVETPANRFAVLDNGFPGGFALTSAVARIA